MTSTEVPEPHDEERRLLELYSLDVLDTGSEPGLDAFVKAASAICEVPISLITLVDDRRQWFKANFGLDGLRETPREVAFCAHAIQGDDIFEVADASVDPRFANNPLVTAEPHIRFYAGAPLRLSSGATVGTLCVIDRQPHTLDERQRTVLRHLAQAAVATLEGRRALRHERRLRVSEARFSALLQHSVDAIIGIDLDGIVTDWNAAAERLYGYPAQEILGSPITVLAPADDAAALKGYEKWLERPEEGQIFEAVRRHKDGTLIPVSVSIAPVYDNRGRLIGASKLDRDMRERMLIEQAAIKSETLFRNLSEASPLGVYLTDELGNCSYTNARWQEIYGLNLQQSLGAGWIDAIHPEDHVAVVEEWQRTAASSMEFSMEFRVRRADGSVRHVHSRARPLPSSGDRPGGFVGSVEDVTEGHNMLARLEANEARLRRLYESTPAMLYSMDVRGRLLSVSDDWLAKLGYQRDQVIGRMAVEFLTPASRALMADQILDQLFDSGHVDAVELQMLTAAGEQIDVLLSAYVERGASGQPLRALAVLADVTLRRRAERALESEHMRLLNILEGTQAGTWEWNVQTGEARFNERWAGITGHTLAELGPTSFQTWLDLTHPADASHSADCLNAHWAGDTEIYECEVRMRHREGHWVWVLTRGRVITWTADGQPEWMYGTHQDISVRKTQHLALEEMNQRISLATESGGIGIWDYDLVSGVVVWDPLMSALYGWSPESRTVSYAEWVAHVHPEDREATERAFAEVVARGERYSGEFRVVRDDGSIAYLNASARPKFDASGRVIRMVGVNWDVSQLRQLAAEVSDQHELMRVTLQSIGDAVITTDPKGLVQWLNPVAERMTGWWNNEARGRPLTQVFKIVHEDTRQATENPVERCLQQGKVVGLANHTILIARDGREFGIEDSAAPIRNEHGEIFGAVLVFHDVTETRRLSNEMTYRATHDALTGLLNRVEFESRLRHVLASAIDEQREHALMYIDLDQFKLVNDTCGHSIGDELLQQVSRLLSEIVRSRDSLARLGGDEFGIILEHCSVEQALRVAQQICTRMDDFRFVHGERRFRIGTSIGLVPVDRRWNSTAAILQAADISCYAAKEAGRNRVHTWFDSDMEMRARHGQTEWAARIEQALDEGRFLLFGQRIEALNDGDSGMHIEVLIRMVDADERIILPEAFLPAAERFHLCSRIDRWVLRRAIDWLESLSDDSRIGMLAVNLSGQSIGDRAFHRDAMHTLAKTRPAIVRKLCFEITETAAITNLADATLFIEQVRGQGVQIALDDFGAGASSFGYLKSLSVDFLKIDGQFVTDLLEDPLDDAAVRCFQDVARVVGVRTVAEFVDGPEVLARLREIGIDYAQGFYLHEPELLADLLSLA